MAMVGEFTPNWFSGCSVPAIPCWFSITCHESCGRDESLGSTTCLKTVVGGKQGHVLCKILLPQQSLFFVSVEFNVDHKTVTKLR